MEGYFNVFIIFLNKGNPSIKPIKYFQPSKGLKFMRHMKKAKVSLRVSKGRKSRATQYGTILYSIKHGGQQYNIVKGHMPSSQEVRKSHVSNRQRVKKIHRLPNGSLVILLVV